METVLQLTTFSLWKHVNSTLHPSSLFLKTLYSPVRSAHHLRLHYILSQAVVAVRLVRNLCLRQYHQFVVPNMHGPDGLGEAKVPPIRDIVHSEVEPWGVGRPAPRRRQRRVDSVSVMEYRVS